MRLCVSAKRQQAARMRGHAAEGLGADTDHRRKCENTVEVRTMRALRTVRWLSKWQHAAKGMLEKNTTRELSYSIITTCNRVLVVEKLTVP